MPSSLAARVTLPFERALKEAGGSVTRASRLLGFRNHNTLANKLNTWHRDLLPTRSPVIPRKCSLIFVNETEKETRPVTILHIEDNQLVADAVKETLELEGWIVESFGEGNAALKMLSSETHYDVLIFDNELPGVNGLELIREARGMPHRQQLPILMLSASDVEREARRNGANAFLKKPEEITLVTETIARLLARKRRP